MRLRRDHIIALALVLLVVVISGVLGVWQGQASGVPLASDSNAESGARALALWLQSMGYQVSPIEYQALNVPDGTDILFVLGPLTPFSQAEIEGIDRWVQRGGTLIVAVEPLSDVGGSALMGHFGVHARMLPGASVTTVTPGEALLTNPPVGEIHARTDLGLTIDECRATVVYAWADDMPVLVGLSHGDGRVWLTTMADAFTNRQMHNEDNARLVLNILAQSSNTRRIVFDEVHHGREALPQTLQSWLTGTPAGGALLFACAALFAFVLIQGRRFGRPVPEARMLARRAPEEYILAMANLFRRGGLRDATARQYHDRLKRVLAGPFRIDPVLSDAQFVAELARYRDDLDQEALLNLLRGLARGGIGEAELVRLAGEAARWERGERGH